MKFWFNKSPKGNLPIETQEKGNYHLLLLIVLC